MKIKLHALLLASAAFFVGSQASANPAGTVRVATLSNQAQESILRANQQKDLTDQCISIAQSWDSGNQTTLKTCLNHPGLSAELKQKLQRLAQASSTSDPQLLAQANPLTLESLQRQINSMKDTINLLVSTASTSTALA